MRTFKCEAIVHCTARPDRFKCPEPPLGHERARTMHDAARAFAQAEAERLYGASGLATHLSQQPDEPHVFAAFVGAYQGRGGTRGNTVLLRIEEVQ
jgi:hypothetical protein